MNWEQELIAWCETQDESSIEEVVSVLERKPENIGIQILYSLWSEAVGEQPRETTEGPKLTESQENLELFYRRFPVLPIGRPLMVCPGCSLPPWTLLNKIKCLASHGKTSGWIAQLLRSEWTAAFPEATAHGERPETTETKTSPGVAKP